MEQLVGPVLVRGASSSPESASSLADKTVALYFSASWCPPCRQFTPQLVQFYRRMQTAKPGCLEIVFVSSDKDARSFAQYFAEMPWLALPFSERARKDSLSAAFHVSGIPALVVLDPGSSKVLSTKGVDLLRRDPSGASFPWRQAAAAAASLPTFAGPTLLYFAAAGDPFTGVLTKWVATVPHPPAVVHVNTNPGLAHLRDVYDVAALPALLLVDKEGRVMVADARVRVEREPGLYPWPPKPVELLAVAADTLAHTMTAVLFLDKLVDGPQMAGLATSFTAVAVSLWNGGKATGESTLRFAVTHEDDEITGRLRLQAGLARDRDGWRLVVYHASAGAAYVHTGDGTEAAQRQFVEEARRGFVPATRLRAV